MIATIKKIKKREYSKWKSGRNHNFKRIKNKKEKPMDIILKIILLLIGFYLVSFGCMAKVKDKPSFIIGKITPVVFGMYIIFYVSYGG